MLSDLNEYIIRMKHIESKIKDYDAHISTEGRLLVECCAEQSGWIAYYDQLAVEAKHIYNIFEMYEKGKRGELFRLISDTISKKHTDTVINNIIDSHGDYKEIHIIKLDALLLYEKIKSMVETFKHRGFMLTNVVKCYDKEIQHVRV